MPCIRPDTCWASLHDVHLAVFFPFLLFIARAASLENKEPPCRRQCRRDLSLNLGGSLRAQNLIWRQAYVARPCAKWSQLEAPFAKKSRETDKRQETGVSTGWWTLRCGRKESNWRAAFHPSTSICHCQPSLSSPSATGWQRGTAAGLRNCVGVAALAPIAMSHPRLPNVKWRAEPSQGEF